jgi:hypothetical protein
MEFSVNNNALLIVAEISEDVVPKSLSEFFEEVRKSYGIIQKTPSIIIGKQEKKNTEPTVFANQQEAATALKIIQEIADEKIVNRNEPVLKRVQLVEDKEDTVKKPKLLQAADEELDKFLDNIVSGGYRKNEGDFYVFIKSDYIDEHPNLKQKIDDIVAAREQGTKVEGFNITSFVVGKKTYYGFQSIKTSQEEYSKKRVEAKNELVRIVNEIEISQSIKSKIGQTQSDENALTGVGKVKPTNRERTSWAIDASAILEEPESEQKIAALEAVLKGKYKLLR